MPLKEGLRLPLQGEVYWDRTAVSDRGYSRSAAKTDSGSEPETLPTAIQPKRLTSAPIKNESAASGMKEKNRRTSASGPFKISPIRAMFVYRAIGGSVFIDTEPNQQCRLNRGRIKPEEVKRSDSVSEQFQ